jgi:hypothetical protein
MLYKNNNKFKRDQVKENPRKGKKVLLLKKLIKS